MISPSLLTKYSSMKFVPTGLLFELDLQTALKTRSCPYCLRKLYEMRDRPYWYCRNKKHKRFLVASSKLIPKT